MRYVAANTTIPVPHVYHHGTAAQNTTGLGPFIVMDYIDHHTNMSRELLDPTKPPDSRPVLNHSISEEKLELLYSQMAKILLQLNSLGSFPAVGSLVEDMEQHSQQHNVHDIQLQHEPIQVKRHPLTMNMTDIVIDTDAPHDILPPPTQIFTSSRDWYTALSDMHMAQLVYQQNDCIEDEDDVRDKYTARKLFKYLATSGGLLPPAPGTSLQHSEASPSTDESNTFILFAEDLRPANVLLDKNLNVVGVIDWEFVYSAPAEFSSDPPWWLLLSAPEDYPGGITSWMRDYEPRLATFLRVLDVEERKLDTVTKRDGYRDSPHGNERVTGRKKRTWSRRRDQKREIVSAVPRLSEQMRQSWETGRWMINYAARKSWMFDLIWWRFLDEWYFGGNEEMDYKARLGMLSEAEREVMERLVRRKLGEMGLGTSSDRDEEEAANPQWKGELLREMLA